MTTKPLAIATSFLFSAAVLPAATNITLVQWGEDAGATDIVTSTQSVTTDTTFVSGDVDSPTVGASYYPNASGRNPDFNVAGSDDTWSINVENDAAGDSITFAASTNSNTDSIVIWEDFSPMTAVLDYTFNLNSSVSNGFPEQAKYRLVMQDGAGDWYIQGNSTFWGFDTSNVNASDITWYDYEPYFDGADSISDEPKSPTIAGAQAFGYRQFNSFGANMEHNVSFFQVMAVVPEPSSTALLGLGGLVMALRRKRG
ncbi:MAG: PEP-CTERM sorting domain-containing protein [Akkermansiaceae bacterium]